MQQRRTVVDEPVDLAIFQPLCEEGGAFQRELITTFLTHGELTLAGIHNAIRAGDAAALRQAAHSLKGAAGGIGAEPLSRAAEALELAAREGRADMTVATLEQAVVGDFERVANFLRALPARP